MADRIRRKLWAIIGTTPGDGIWGMGKPPMPLVTTNQLLVRSLLEKADQIKRAANGRPYQLVSFTEDINGS